MIVTAARLGVATVTCSETRRPDASARAPLGGAVFASVIGDKFASFFIC